MSFLGIDPNKDFFNQLSGAEQPQYQSVDLDPGTKGLIQGSVDRANQPYKSSNIEQNASMLMPKAATGFLTSPGTGQAIANKYATLAGEHVQALKNQQTLTDQEHQFKQTGMAFHNMMQQQQVQNANYGMYLKQIKDEQAVRASTLNFIFGAGGAIGGAAAGGASKGKKQNANNPMPNSNSGNRSIGGGDEMNSDEFNA